MARIRGKAATVLAGAQQRIDVAQEAVNNARLQLDIAEATLRAHKHAYDELERSLAPASRAATATKSSVKRSTAAAKRSGGKKRATPPVLTDDPNTHCQKQFPGGIVCDEPVDANVHQLRGATGYHEFAVAFQPSVGNTVDSDGDTKAATAGAGIQTADIGPLL